MTFDGKCYKSVDQHGEVNAGAFPKVERQRAGNGVDFVHVNLACGAVDHHVYAAYPVARECSEGLPCKSLNLFGFVLGKVGRKFLC